MSGLFSILNTLAQQVNNACYPNGTSSPSVTGNQITIEAGFPIRTQLDVDLQSGYSHVYVYPDPKQRDVTTFERVYNKLIKTPPTIITSVNNNTVTFSGSVSVPQAVMIVNNGIGYAYNVLISDTLSSIATALASLIPGAASIGPVITILGSYSLSSYVATNYTAGRELSRTEGIFNIFIDSPNPIDRSIILDAIDVYLKINFRIVAADDFYILLFYNDVKVMDSLEKEGIYQARLMYMIQFPTTDISNFTSITHPFVNSIEVKWQ